MDHTDAMSVVTQDANADLPAGDEEPQSGVHISAANPAGAVNAGTPLKAAIGTLKAQAASGNAAAASRLFADLRTCTKVRNIEQMPLDRTLNAIKSGQLEAGEGALTDMQGKLDFAESNSELCSGISMIELMELTPATLQAAKLGDMSAIECYVAMGIMGVGAMPGLIDHPEWLSDYKKNVMPLVQTAMSRGNWNVVTMLQSTHMNGGENASILGQAIESNPLQAYRYLRLMDSGYVGGNPHWQEELSRLAKEIKPEARRDADAWAQETYQHYYRSSPIADMKGPLACALF